MCPSKLNKFIIARLLAETMFINLKVDYGDPNDIHNLERTLLSILCRVIGLKLKITRTMLDNISNNGILSSIITDLLANFKRDPSCQSFITGISKPVFKVVSLYRLSLLFNKSKYKVLMYIKQTYGVEIGLGARLGERIVLDHTHGIVIGQQVEIGDNVMLMHGITLGATGNQLGLKRRHPRIGSGSNIGASSIILGGIEIGHCVNVGANTVVTRRALPYNVLVGVPAQALLN
ncbi:Serine acetyltransferase, partial [Candidatus Hodgkinia cicadicola]